MLLCVCLEQSTNPLTTLDIANRQMGRIKRLVPSRLPSRRNDQVVVQALVRALQMIVISEFTAQHIQVSRPENDEVIESLLLKALDHAFHEGNRVWRANRGALSLDLFVFEDLQEGFRVLAVIVVHHNLTREILRLRMFDECRGLLDHSLFMGLVGRRRDKHSPRLYMQKHQHEGIAKAGLRHNLLGEEVTLPHRVGVSLEELVPSARPAFGASVVAAALQDVLHRVLGH